MDANQEPLFRSSSEELSEMTLYIDMLARVASGRVKGNKAQQAYSIAISYFTDYTELEDILPEFDEKVSRKIAFDAYNIVKNFMKTKFGDKEVSTQVGTVETWVESREENTDSLSMMFCFIENIFYLPFRVIYDLVITGLLIGAFILWFGLIFGSVIAVVLILIFAPNLFLLPAIIAEFYIPIWEECSD